MPDEQQPSSPAPDAQRSLLARLRNSITGIALRARGSLSGLYRFRRLIIASACVVFALTSAVMTARYVQSVREETLAQGLTLEASLAHLDKGEYAEARNLARLLPADKKIAAERLGEVHFVIGAAVAYETDKAWDEPNRANFYALAARYLQEAEADGYPDGRTHEGRLLLARCLIESGQYESSLAPLLAIDDSVPAATLEADRMLALAYLKSRPPQLEKAAAHAQEFSKAAQASPSTRDRAALLQGEIALAQQKLDAAGRWIEQIPDESDLVHERQMMRGRLALVRAKQLDDEAEKTGDAEAARSADQLYTKSVELLRDAMSHHASGQGLSSQASYLIGTAFRRQGELAAAQDQFFRTRKRFYNTPEAIVASLAEAEVLLELGRLEEGSDALERTAQGITSPDRLANPYLNTKQLRERVEKGFNLLYQERRFDLAAQLAKSLGPLVGGGFAAELRADALHRWGNHLHHQALTGTVEEADNLQRQGRKKYRLAGYAFADLAHQRYITREYPEALWKSGDSFNRGRDYQNATVVLNKYLETEAQTERPLVLIALTKAYLALNMLEEARATIEDCLRDFSRDPSIYRARLLASTVHMEAGNIERAKELLQANLHHDALNPRSDAWRDTLFALGFVLHQQGQSVMLRQSEISSTDSGATKRLEHLERGHRLLHQAIRRLSEAVARYPQAEQVIRARYELGESYRYGSQMPLAKYHLETITSRRTTLNNQINEELTSALTHYDELVRILNEKSHRDDGLSDEEEKILRNVYFARGTVLYDLGDYDSAIKAYSTATSRYQHEPAALEAYVQIAACYRRLNKPLESRGTLEQAKLVIERIANESEFVATTRFDRDEWTSLLNWLSSL